MIKIYAAEHPTEAHYLSGLLEGAGIRCLVQGEALAGVQGGVPITVETAPSVWVIDAAQAAEARAVIAEYERQRAGTKPEAPGWTCRSCGEECEPQFTSCWHCLAPRDEP